MTNKDDITDAQVKVPAQKPLRPLYAHVAHNPDIRVGVDTDNPNLYHLTGFDAATNGGWNAAFPDKQAQGLIIPFQDGPLGEGGAWNGVTIESLVAVVIDRIKVLNFKKPARENALAITNFEQGMMWLQQRERNMQIDTAIAANQADKQAE